MKTGRLGGVSAQAGAQKKQSMLGDELSRLRVRWEQLPQWEKELRLLLHLSFAMPYMGPPTGIIDNGPPSEDSFLPFRDPATTKIHPYVKRKYLDPLLTSKDIVDWVSSRQSLSEGLTGGASASRVYPPLFLSPEDFETSGCFIRPYPDVKSVIKDIGGRVRELLGQMRLSRSKTDVQPENLPSMFGWHMPKALRDELVRLDSKGVDVPWVYGIFIYSGSALLWMLAFYRDLQKKQAELRKKVTKGKRSVLSMLRECRRRFSSSTVESVEKEAEEILNSLALIKHPLDDAVHRYRRSLGLHRKGTKPSQQDFWKIIFKYTVSQLKERHFSEKQACQAVACLLRETWPKVRLSWEAIKGRYSRSNSVPSSTKLAVS